MMLLSKEEIQEAGAWHSNPFLVKQEVAKAQLKKVVEWCNEPCPHTHNPNYFKPRRNCDDCWQSLLDEVKE